MIPNNQFWFNNKPGGDTPNPDSGYVYNPLLTKNNTQNEYAWRDGNALVYFDGKLRMLGGWNDDNAFGAGLSNTTTNQVWESTDRGYIFTAGTAATWVKRHSMGYGVKDSKIWIWGGDLMQGTYQKDVWSYTTAGGWVQATSDWGAGVGDRVLFSHCIHDGYLYVAGGQTGYGNSETMFTDIYRSSDGITWSKIGDLPAALTHFSTGCMVSLNDKLYIFSGGEYKSSGATNYNNKIYVSLNHGASWSLVGDVPSSIENMMYANATAFDGKLWIIKGAQNGVNAAGLYHSLDGLTWTAVTPTPAARHAAGICTNGDELYIVGGNELTQLDGPFAVNAIPQDATLDSDAQAYINKLFPTASAQYQTEINTAIVSLKAGNHWNSIQAWWNLATEYRWHSWIDVKRPTATRITENNSPTFTANQGYTGGGTKYLNTNFNTSTDGGSNVLNNNLFHAVYNLTNSAGAFADAGITNAPRDLAFLTKWGDGGCYIGTNWVGEENFGALADPRGFIVAKRITNTSTGYRNGAVVGSPTTHTPDAALPNLTDYIGGMNTNNVLALVSTRQIAMRMWGSGNSDIPAITTIIQAFATARGFVQL